MTPTVLVVTTVHSPDDTRIRDRLIRSLADTWHVAYAAREPGPADDKGLTWLPLRGGRLLRNVRALTHLLRGEWDAAVVHDPELIPAALVARAARKRPVIFDVHEDLPAQIASKAWIPRWLRPVSRSVARVLYRLAERGLRLTLAEPGYQRLFRKRHQVFPNYPNYETWPEPQRTGDGSAVYLGDVQPARGLVEAVVACGRSGTPLTVIGPVSSTFSSELRSVAFSEGADLRLLGPMPNPEALRAISGASVGLSPLLALPNYQHSLPTKVMEYLAMGLPVVATDLPGTREALGSWETVWLVPPGQAQPIADAVAAARTPESREMAFRKVQLARQSFVWPRDEVVAFYDSLLSR